jgi:hypothetical protein
VKTRSFSPSYIAAADSYHPVISLISASNSPVTFAMVATSMPESSDLKAIRRWGSRNNGNEGVAAGLRLFFRFGMQIVRAGSTYFFLFLQIVFRPKAGWGMKDGIASGNNLKLLINN